MLQLQRHNTIGDGATEHGYGAMTLGVDSTQTADALAWSECDDPYLVECAADLYSDGQDDEAESSRWAWAFVVAAWAAGAAAIAVVIGMAFVAFTPQQPTPQHSPPPTESPYPYIGLPFGDTEPARNT